VCETADKPAVIIFARSLHDPLAKLVRQLDQAVIEHQGAGLRAWVTFLSTDQPALDPQLVQWSRQHAIRSVPLGVFEDVKGPPSYRLGQDADVTVLLYVHREVVANFAFRSGKLTNGQIDQVMQALPKIVTKK
jgi:hypothetical protein